MYFSSRPTWVFLTLFFASNAAAQSEVPAYAPSWTAGDAQGLAFGLIVDVAAEVGGGVYVLDEAAPGFTLLNSGGSKVASLEGLGEGPNEFAKPRDIDVAPDGRPVVLDVGQGRLKWFKRVGSEFVYDDSWAPPLNLNAFCFMGEDIIGVAMNLVQSEPALFHRFNAQRNLVASFGIPPEQTEIPVSALGDGRMICLPDRDMIVYLPDVYGRVYAFSASGELLWTSQLPNYTQMTIEAGTGWIRYRAGEEGYTHMGTALLRQGDRIIAQWGRVDRATPRKEEVEEVITAALSVTDGRTQWVSEDVPRLGTSQDGFVYGYTNWPLPTATKYRVSR